MVLRTANTTTITIIHTNTVLLMVISTTITEEEEQLRSIMIMTITELRSTMTIIPMMTMAITINMIPCSTRLDRRRKRRTR